MFASFWGMWVCREGGLLHQLLNTAHYIHMADICAPVCLYCTVPLQNIADKHKLYFQYHLLKQQIYLFVKK